VEKWNRKKHLFLNVKEEEEKRGREEGKKLTQEAQKAQ